MQDVLHDVNPIIIAVTSSLTTPYRRVIVTVRQEVLPALSVALTVIRLKPRWSGIVAIQFVVPVAVPDPPKLFSQVMLAMPLASDALPAITRRLAVVITPAVDGLVIVSEGAVRSVGAGGGVGMGVGVGAGVGVGVGAGVGVGTPALAAAYKVRIAFLSSV
jgi:hypothetical protein